MDSGTAKTAIGAQIREDECIRLYTTGGLTLDEIAAQVGYADRSGAHRAIQRALKRRYQETAADRDALIQWHLEITRELVRGLAPKALKGETRAAEVIILALAREAKLLGLDATVRVDLKVTDAMMAEVQELVEQMASLDAQQAQQEAAKARG